MQWRNEQIYHLRQINLLNKENQDKYFDNIVNRLFNETRPDQVLFSYLQNDICIGYGGLVHINWIDRNAEISFLLNTKLELDFFEFHWNNFLILIEKIAFSDLNMHKIFTYSFNLRPRLYTVLNKNQYKEEARLKEHVIIDNKPHDVLIHSKFNGSFKF